ncbi:MAG TPA: alpha/beta hydrolase [Gammaproteobacteria bacterium]|jgi:pimeloyl-ACP methyl ester carboxylesterase|nr:alpha/beta hydrolase [Gammaproteobacteria bacterium]
MYNNLRKYGKLPFQIALIHGGPGAPGELAPLARELAKDFGVLEPLQTQPTLEGQVQELKDIIENNGEIPLVLIGFSWGAMLSFIVTARYPSLVKKLIMISSAIFDDKYSNSMSETRLKRLSTEEKNKINDWQAQLDNPEISDKNKILSQLAEFDFKADCYAPLPYQTEILEYQFDIHQSVWSDAKKFRQSGALIQLGRQIQCPVVAIHGDFDSHPSDGVKIPLASVIKDFQFILLEKCGHYPWIEKFAKDVFIRIIKSETS